MGLCSPFANMISAQASKPNIGIVQDSLLGAYQMTRGTPYIKKYQFFDICMRLTLNPTQILDKLFHIRQMYRKMGKTLGKTQYTGRALISLCLPDDFNYSKSTDIDPDEPLVKIYRGVLYEGTIGKPILGSVHNSIIHVLHKEYGPERAGQFVDEIQFITNGWLMVKGFSIGIKDCMIPKAQKAQEQKIKDTIYACYIKADRAVEGTAHGGIQEMRIGAALAGARDMGLRIARDALQKDNNLIQPIISGSKGSMFNATQVLGCLGQQNVNGGRIPLVLNNGKRSMVHYPFGDMTAEMRYESRGFVRESFGEGLGPRSMWAHAAAGREGVCNTAMSTADSGYMQRKIVKVIEDCCVQHDGTVRDTTNRIFQFAYNQDGYNPANTVKVKGSQESMDISRMVDRLNTQHEVDMELKQKEERKAKKVSLFKKSRSK